MPVLLTQFKTIERSTQFSTKLFCANFSLRTWDCICNWEIHFHRVKKHIFILCVESNFSGFPYIYIKSLIQVPSTFPLNCQVSCYSHNGRQSILHKHTQMLTYKLIYMQRCMDIHTLKHILAHIQILTHIRNHSRSQTISSAHSQPWMHTLHTLKLPVTYTNTHKHTETQNHTLSWNHSHHACTSLTRRTAVSPNFWMPQNGSFPTLYSPSNPVTVTKTIFTTIHNI